MMMMMMMATVYPPGVTHEPVVVNHSFYRFVSKIHAGLDHWVHWVH